MVKLSLVMAQGKNFKLPIIPIDVSHSLYALVWRVKNEPEDVLTLQYIDINYA